jgi:CheY-like chemotaxis protein
MPRIFLSYRREDSEHVAGRIYDRLEAHFGGENVFMDVAAIPFGVDFREHLDRAVGQCDVLLAVIGERWLDARFVDGPRQGQRRLDDPADFLRIEIQSALARGIPVIPVLVGGARMPVESDLPEGLRGLAYRNATEVRSGRDFRDHVDRLTRGIEEVVRSREAGAARPAAAQQEAVPSAGQPLQILLVEEVSFHQKAARLILGGEGHSLAVASSGQDALAALERQPFDLVLMQVQMAGTDGIEVTATIRKSQEAWRWVPILGMTNEPALREKCLQAGMDACVARPVKAAEVRDAIQRCVGVVDWNEALEQAGGDESLLRELVEVYLKEHREWVDRIRASIDGDSSRVQSGAHSVKWMLSGTAERVSQGKADYANT